MKVPSVCKYQDHFGYRGHPHSPFSLSAQRPFTNDLQYRSGLDNPQHLPDKDVGDFPNWLTCLRRAKGDDDQTKRKTQRRSKKVRNTTYRCSVGGRNRILPWLWNSKEEEKRNKMRSWQEREKGVEKVLHVSRRSMTKHSRVMMCESAVCVRVGTSSRYVCMYSRPFNVWSRHKGVGVCPFSFLFSSDTQMRECHGWETYARQINKRIVILLRTVHAVVFVSFKLSFLFAFPPAAFSLRRKPILSSIRPCIHGTRQQ